MPTYFKPLRWKLGVVTLVAACALSALWMRSRTELECVGVGIGRNAYSCRASEGVLHFRSLRPTETPPLLIWGSTHLADFVNAFPPKQFGEYCILCVPESSNNRWVGEMSFSILPKQKRQLDVIVPYWSIVTPLTLLSAWLLLSRPRKPSAPKPNPLR